MRVLTTLLILVMSTATAASTQHIRVQELGGGITLLLPDEGSGNTIVLDGPDGALIIDTMADTIAREFVDTLERLGIDDVRWVLNTHWHQNHLGANGEFASAAILGPRELRARLSETQQLQFLVQNSYPALPEPWRPNTIYVDSVAVHVNGQEVRAWHVKGHTDTDQIIWLTGSNVVATGDLWSQFTPFMTDLDTGGSWWGVASALTDILERVPADALVIPGHTPPTDMSALRAYRDGLVATLEFVAQAREGGRTIGEIASGPLPDAVSRFFGQSSEGARRRYVEAAWRSERR